MKALALPASVVPILLVLVAVGCGGARQARSVPDVRGQRLDVAEAVLDRAHLDFETRGGGLFGVVSASRWWVCKQLPRPHAKSTSVLLVVARSCSVPDVEWSSLSDAEDVLDRAGIDYETVTVNGRVPVLKSLWTVCDQEPAAGTNGSFVSLYVARDCYADWWNRL